MSRTALLPGVEVEVSVDPQLLEILACPDTHHAPLTYDELGQTLTCTECERAFPIRDGLPVLLLDEAVLPGVSAAAPEVNADTDETGGGGR